jgi:hypothetical protein
MAWIVTAASDASAWRGGARFASRDVAEFMNVQPFTWAGAPFAVAGAA